MYVYINMYVYIYVYINVYIYIYICVCMYIYMYLVYVCVCIYIYVTHTSTLDKAEYLGRVTFWPRLSLLGRFASFRLFLPRPDFFLPRPLPMSL